jgi:imidazolonepropionase-like amidohydrolase
MAVPSAILRRIALGIVLAAPLAMPSVLGAQSGTWALTNARIETVSKGVIENGTIIIRNGLITAVGPDAAIPADARVIDMTKRTVAPGLIDLTSTAGLPAAAASAGAGGRGGAPALGAAAPGGFTGFTGFDPHRVVADEVNISLSDARSARESGVTAVLVAPNRGALRGLSALMPMRDSVKGLDALRSPVAEHFGFSGGGGGFGGGGKNAEGEPLPGTIMGVIAYQRQALYDAKQRGIVSDRWHADPRGIPRPVNNPEIDALVPVVRGNLPVFYDANVENEIRRAVKVDKEFGIRFTIVGATEGYKAVDALAGHPVVVSLNFPTPAASTGWSYYNAQRHTPQDSVIADREAKKVIEANAATLNKAGIKFALASGGQSAASFIANARKAVAGGLPADIALQAMTIRAAEIAGLDKALGSIEVGKIANLVVTEGGNILADSAKVRAVFVDGVRYEIAAPPAAPAARAGGGGRGGNGGAAGDAAVAQVGGAWRLTIDSPQGAQTVTMNITQTGPTFTAKVSGLPTGDADVTDGRIAGNKATWSLSLNMGGNALQLDFSGDIAGSKMTGTVALGAFGNATFSGEKTP